jgi:hypothetical protein
MGAALTYARRYALFTLVGIAGEDDLDAPELPGSKLEGDTQAPLPSARPGTRTNGHIPTVGHATRSASKRGISLKPLLSADDSATLRSRFVSEIDALASADEMLAWACRTLPAKNTLTDPDARLVENAFRAKMDVFVASDASLQSCTLDTTQTEPSSLQAALVPASEGSAEPAVKIRRRRSKPHRDFVSSQPCLVCGRQPADAHHLRFAQPRAMARKVSDEFIVPLCRAHHRELHRMGDERGWWARIKINPIEVAERLWQTTNRNSSTVEAEPGGEIAL